MRKVSLLFVLILLVMLSAASTQAQGISAILERLDSLEQQIDGMGTSLEDIQSSNPGSSEVPDFSAYDKSLADIEIQLASLSNELAELPPEGTVGMDPAVEARIAKLEQQNQELIPLLQEVKEGQDSGFAEVQATLAGDAVVPAAACAPAACGDEKAVACDELSISGFVDASYFYDGESGNGSFGLDQVEIDVERTIGSSGSLRFDVEWVSDGAGGFTPDVEQGYVTYSPDFAGDNFFTFGKFNAPIGFELLDAPDMFQYSHALVFNYGLPTNLTGLMYSAQFSSAWDFSGYVCNGWDVNVDPDNDKSIGGRLGYAGGDWGGIGFSAIHGTESVDDTTTTQLTVFDVDISFDPAENWTMGGELNFGSNDLGAETATWWGFLVMSHWDFTSVVGGTIRFDYFDDTDNSRLGGSVPEVRTAIAIAPTFVLGDGMGALIEVRLDSSDQEVFTDSDGAPSDTAVTMAFEMTYTF